MHRYKDTIGKLQEAGKLEGKISALEAEKRAAVQAEDFMKAAKLKKKLMELKEKRAQVQQQLSL